MTTNNVQKVLDKLKKLNAKLRGDRKEASMLCDASVVTAEAIALIELMAKGEAVACQYALDVAMPEYRCVGKCQYDTHPQPAESGVSEAQVRQWLEQSRLYEMVSVDCLLDFVKREGKRLAPESREVCNVKALSELQDQTLVACAAAVAALHMPS